MNTKFIGLEGFNEIESLSTDKKRAGKKASKPGKTQKLIRFIKRATAAFVKSVKKNFAKLTAFIGTKHSLAKAKQASRPQTAILDRQYSQNRKGSSGAYAKESLSNLSSVMTKKKTFAHSAATGSRTHVILKKRAVLAVVACLTAILLSCVTVASALDMPMGSANTAPKNVSADYAATADEITNAELEAPELYVSSAYSSLYIDGELIGTTSEADQLDAALNKLLVDFRKDYDDTTTTEFANDVHVEKHSYDNSELMTADEIMAAADGKFSISLQTDWSYEVEIDYDTDVTYDEEQDSTYEEVVTEGKKGLCEVNLRLTYVDGVFVDSVVTDTKITKEPVTEKVIRGSKQGEPEKTTGGSTGSFIWPVSHTHTISSYYEWRWGRMHNGIDIAGGGDYGQPIMAADGGIVTYAGNDGGGYGNYVMIDHGNGYVTVYGHASSLAVSTGQYVGQGEVIAYVGSTGNSTGPHLHFEIRLNGEYQNPLDYVS